MQDLFKRTGAFLLAILVWVATSSFSLSMHYCGSQMVSYSTIGKAKTCCEANQFQLSTQDLETMSMMSCCHDKEVEKESEDQITFSIAKVEVHLQQVLLRLPQLVSIDLNSEAPSLSASNIQAHDYLPLNYSSNRTVLFQVFRI